MAKRNASNMKPDPSFDFFEIDKNRLDEEWINQPKLYFQYSDQLTEAKEDVARLTAQIEIANDDRKAVRAALDLKIRKNPEKFLGKDVKLTESALSNRILIHSKYKEAQQKVYDLNSDLIEANKKVGHLYSAVFTLDHRKAALERLVSLHGQNYFSVPRASDTNEIAEKAEKKKARTGRRRRRS